MADRKHSNWLDDVYGNYHSWKGWEAPPHPNQKLLFQIELDRTKIKPPASLLEIGYGSGEFLRYAHDVGYRCSGLELSDTLTASLRALSIDARTGHVGDFADSTVFDLVVAFDVFEHMTPEEILKTLKEIRKCISYQGRVLARFPNATSPFGAITQYGDITHRTALSGESFAQLAHVAGFDAISTTNSAWLWRGNSRLKSLIKPFSILVRRACEGIFGFAYYGRLVPLDPSITVILRPKEVISTN